MSETGLSWTEVIDGVEFYKDSFVDAYKELTNCSQETAQDLFSTITDEYSISPEDFAKLIKEYLDEKGSNNRIIFLTQL